MSDGRTPAEVFGSIMQEFARRRKQEKTAAWLYLQGALAESASVISPSIVSLKDLVSAIANVEDMLKGTAQNTGQSPVEYLETFLNTSPAPDAPKKAATQ